MEKKSNGSASFLGYETTATACGVGSAYTSLMHFASGHAFCTPDYQNTVTRGMGTHIVLTYAGNLL